jgi:type II secretory pathway pseudopilin PulG
LITRFRNESGETLTELLITMVIMSVGMLGVVAALGTTIVGSSTHRGLAQAEVVARNFAEATKNRALSASSGLHCPAAPAAGVRSALDPVGASPYTAGSGTIATKSNPSSPILPHDDVAAGLVGNAGWKVKITKVEYWIPDPGDFGSSPTDGNTGTWTSTQSTCTAYYNSCVAASGFTTPAEATACDPGLQRVSFDVFNTLPKYDNVDTPASVVTRTRRNPS